MQYQLPTAVQSDQIRSRYSVTRSMFLKHPFSYHIFSCSYYMICIGTTQNGNIQMSIKTKMQEAVTTVVTNAGAVEIQRIDMGADPMSEHQVNQYYSRHFIVNICFYLKRIVYSSSAGVDGRAEIQEIPTFHSQTEFQIGFRGVYTSESNSLACLESHTMKSMLMINI